MSHRRIASTVAVVLSFVAVAAFQANAQDRLPQAIPANAAQVALPHSVLPKARLATDLGAAPADKTLETLSLRFSMTSAQTTALDKLLADQLNPASPRYHQWLTPEQFGAQFGLSTTDLAIVSNWLQTQGFTVTGVGRGRTFISFSGSVGQVNQAFGVSLRTLSLDGEQHVGNLTDPVLPAPIAGVVTAVTGLNDFRLKPRSQVRRVPARPSYNGGTSYGNLIAPGDFYTIYDINPLLASSINGAGVSIAVTGQTDISLSDYAAFRSAAGLSTNNPPTIKVYGTDPGNPSSGDFTEAMIDLEWSGATAPSANILYVNGLDIFNNSVTAAIDNNLAPIITVSYGACEAGFGASSVAQFNTLFKQANAQGQTMLGPAGDSGAADCDYQTTYASNGLAVDFPASSPYVTGVGATEFNEGGGAYWSASNGSNAGSALSYIPEQPWNETYDTDSQVGLFGLKYGGSGGGGVSQVFSKPSWQVGIGVPNDASRDVPDISFNGAAQHVGYLVCAGGNCTNGFADAKGAFNVYGGTSVSTPAFSGILALLEQKLSANGLGNVNPSIYGLANSPYYSSVFHDVTSGSNAVPCSAGSIDCAAGYTNYFPANTLLCPANSCSGDIAYPSIGYQAGAGYDLTTGWGSIDVLNMVADWLLATPTGNAASALNASSTTASTTTASVTAGASVVITANVASASGSSATPTGTLTLLVDSVSTGLTATLNNGSGALPAYSTANLASGQHDFSVSYSGDANYAGSKGSVSVDVVSPTVADFAISPATSTVTVGSGGTSSGITYTVTPVNGFTGAVNFTASTTSSTLNATYAFSVTQVSISGSAAGTTVFTLQAFSSPVTGATRFKSLPRTSAGIGATPLPRFNPWAIGGSGIALAGLFFFALPKPRRRGWTAMLLALVSVGILSAAGCGSGVSASNNINAAPGTYNIVVTAQGTNAAGIVLTHNVNVTFVVQ